MATEMQRYHKVEEAPLAQGPISQQSSDMVMSTYCVCCVKIFLCFALSLLLLCKIKAEGSAQVRCCTFVNTSSFHSAASSLGRSCSCTFRYENN